PLGSRSEPRIFPPVTATIGFGFVARLGTGIAARLKRMLNWIRIARSLYNDETEVIKGTLALAQAPRKSVCREKRRNSGLKVEQRRPSCPMYLPNRHGHFVPVGKGRRVRQAVWVGSDDQMERPDTGRHQSIQFDVDLH